MRVKDSWAACPTVVHDVWTVPRSATFHFIWNDRNRRLFDGRAPVPTAAALSIIFTTFSAHIRFLLRRLYDSVDRDALRTLLDALLQHPGFEIFSADRPHHLLVRAYTQF